MSTIKAIIERLGVQLVIAMVIFGGDLIWTLFKNSQQQQAERPVLEWRQEYDAKLGPAPKGFWQYMYTGKLPKRDE